MSKEMTKPFRKKLIEVALPLLAINDASAYDKMPGIGPHPKGIHHWWARLPLPCARAILFASLVDDPASDPRWEGATPEVHQQERERLFGIITALLQKRIYEHPEAFAAADTEIAYATGGTPPNFLDPFSGGGSLPLEAQRLGLKVTATDLNPIAVLITKATTELAMRFIDTPPVNPSVDDKLFRGGWGRAKGLATDVRYYADWIGAELKKRIGHMFPEAKAQGTQKAPPRTPLAWVWTRTVASPDPACGGAQVPLLRSFKLSTKKGRAAYVEPVVDKASNTWRFVVKTDGGTPASGTIGRKGGRCIISGTPIPLEYIRSEGKAGRLGQRLVATICDSTGGRVYLSPNEEQEGMQTSMPPSLPDAELAYNPFALRPPLYGLNHYTDLFTPRQLWALTTLTDLVQEVGERILKDAEAIKPGERGQGVWDADTRVAYANAVTTFLACAVDRCVDFNNAVTTWIPTNEKVRNLFNRQAIPMVWDFAEANILAKSVGGWHTCSNYVADCIEVIAIRKAEPARVIQADAADLPADIKSVVVSTDPPYYNNIDYADLSDFFYVWMRRCVQDLYPSIFSTIVTPKTRELVATPYRFDGDKQKAKEHFESGFRKVFHSLKGRLDNRFPMTVYYAFKQEDEEEGQSDDEADSDSITLTTGWETLLEALSGAGFVITGTWPVRASQAWRMMSRQMNALASYIVLVCRPRPDNAALATRRDFIRTLNSELPEALRNLQHGNIAPVDLAQASIGPGMAVFTRFSKVIESDGSPMTVRTALGLINQVLGEVLAEQEGEFDADTRWALAWFEQQGMQEGVFGEADVLARAKNTAVNGLVEAGIIKAKSGKVQLLSRAELPQDWNPATDKRLTVWETTQHLIHRLQTKGETEASELLARLGGLGENARDLAYRLYSICERKKWAEEALAYNSLVIAWPELTKLALSGKTRQSSTTPDLFS